MMFFDMFREGDIAIVAAGLDVQAFGQWLEGPFAAFVAWTMTANLFASILLLCLTQAMGNRVHMARRLSAWFIPFSLFCPIPMVFWFTAEILVRGLWKLLCHPIEAAYTLRK